MDKKKSNCWEYKQCGREPGGKNVEELGVCPAATDNESDGINEGNNAGRCCWRIAGTLCAGKVQGSYAKKIRRCSLCNFYKLVKSDVGNKFKP